MRHSFGAHGVPISLGLFLAWTAATWVFEGRTLTLLRPEAVADRLAYALAVNLALGIAGGIALLRWLVRRHGLDPQRCGFASPGRAAVAAPAGFALGLAAYVVQGAPSTNAVVVLNAFAQVFVVSAAEVVVCWALVGCTAEAALRRTCGRAAPAIAAVVSSALFGLYHFAHSPPFNTWPTVGLLAVVGLATGAFFFLTRDVLGTVVFHNFLGVFGVVQALVRADAIRTFDTIQLPLLATALVAACALLAGYATIHRRAAAV